MKITNKTKLTILYALDAWSNSKGLSFYDASEIGTQDKTFTVRVDCTKHNLNAIDACHLANYLHTAANIIQEIKDLRPVVSYSQADPATPEEINTMIKDLVKIIDAGNSYSFHKWIVDHTIKED